LLNRGEDNNGDFNKNEENICAAMCSYCAAVRKEKTMFLVNISDQKIPINILIY
jgi:hypothetical protein